MLDTNLHSDWANEPCRLEASSRARLECLLSDDRVELLVPGWIFVEFQWPPEKQRRWYSRVGRRTTELALLLSSLDSWEASNALARLRGHPSSPPPVMRGFAEQLLAEMQAWHPSPAVMAVREFQRILSELGGTRGVTGSLPEGVAPSVTLPRMGDLKAKMRPALESVEFKEAVREQLQTELGSDLQKALGALCPEFLSGLRDPASVAALLEGVDPSILSPLRALDDLPEDARWALDRLERYMSLRGVLPQDATGDEALAILEAFEKDRSTLPAFGIWCHVAEGLARRRDRKPRPSDYMDMRILQTLTIADYVTTDGDMKSTYGTSGPYQTRGRLFARNELAGMLDAVEGQLRA